MDSLEHLPVFGHRPALHQRLYRVKTVAGVVPAVDLTQAGMAGAVGEDDQIPGKAGRVGPGKSHKHTVIPGHRDDPHFGNDGTVHGSSSS